MLQTISTFITARLFLVFSSPHHLCYKVPIHLLEERENFKIKNRDQ